MEILENENLLCISRQNSGLSVVCPPADAAGYPELRGRINYTTRQRRMHVPLAFVPVLHERSVSAITAKTLGTLALLLCVPASAKDAEHWVRFSNSRFGTIAEFPESLFKAQHPPANGDGRTFWSNDGAELRLYGNYNTEETFLAYKKWLWDLLPNDRIRITYKGSGPSWLAYSGYKGRNVVYRRQVEGCGALHTISATYPRVLKAKYDPVVARIAGSFRCKTPVWDCPKDKGYCKTNVPEYNDGIEWPE